MRLFILLLSLLVFTSPAAHAVKKLVPFVTQSSFADDVLKHDGFVIVDAWAIWCPYCNAAMPHVQGFYDAYGDKVPVFVLDVDEEKGLVDMLGVKGVPRYLLFYKGRLLHQKRTIRSTEHMVQWLNFYAQRELGAPYLTSETFDATQLPEEDSDADETSPIGQ